MDPIQSQIRSKLNAFASDLEALIRQAALEAVGSAFGAPAAKVGRPVGSATKAAAAAPAKRPTATPRAKPASGGRVRRSAEAMAAVSDDILKHIKAHPGQGSESIRAALKMEKKVWAPAIRALIEGKKVSAKGVKRATTYTAK